MLVSALIYVTLVTALFAAAAWSAERAARGRTLPTRLFWAAAVGGALVSLALALSGVPPPAADAVPALTFSTAPALVSTTMSGADPTIASPPLTVPAQMDMWILATWALLSATLLALAFSAWVRLYLEQGNWAPTTIDGRSVLLSKDCGPALVGIARPVVVVPRWLLQMTEADQALMLRHEEEHRAAGDSRLIATAVAALIVLPWNVPLWWIVARLRIALEIDCDRRVLKSVPGVRPYASLLIGAGARRAPSRIGAVVFISAFSFLERRIRAMTDFTPGSPLRALPLAACAALLLAGACYVEKVEVTVLDELPAEQAVAQADEAALEQLRLTEAVQIDQRRALRESVEWMSYAEHPYDLDLQLDGSTLSGTLTDRRGGAPAAGVAVGAPDLALGAVTDERGQFDLSPVGPGTHRLSATHDDFGRIELGPLLIPRPTPGGVNGTVRPPERVTEPGPIDTSLDEDLLRVAEDDVPPPPQARTADAGTGAIVGTVVEFGSDKRLGRARVWVEGPGGKSIGGLTNAQGRFLLLNVPRGAHTLLIERLGYESLSQEVALTGERSSNVRVALRPVQVASAFEEPTRLIVAAFQVPAATASSSPVTRSQAPRISVSLNEEPINNVLVMFSAFTGKSIVASEGVTGFVTVEIKDQPWDRALTAILAAQGLVATEDEDGNMRVDNIRR